MEHARGGFGHTILREQRAGITETMEWLFR